MSKLLLKCLIIVWVHYIEIPGLHLLSELFLFSQLGPYISTFNIITFLKFQSFHCSTLKIWTDPAAAATLWDAAPKDPMDLHCTNHTKQWRSLQHLGMGVGPILELHNVFQWDGDTWDAAWRSVCLYPYTLHRCFQSRMMILTCESNRYPHLCTFCIFTETLMPWASSRCPYLCTFCIFTETVMPWASSRCLYLWTSCIFTETVMPWASSRCPYLCTFYIFTETVMPWASSRCPYLWYPEPPAGVLTSVHSVSWQRLSCLEPPADVLTSDTLNLQQVSLPLYILYLDRDCHALSLQQMSLPLIPWTSSRCPYLCTFCILTETVMPWASNRSLTSCTLPGGAMMETGRFLAISSPKFICQLDLNYLMNSIIELNGW